jgi:hypothetical protein
MPVNTPAATAEERSAALEAAAALLALAMHESHAPVDALGGALERMARALGQAGRAHERAALERDLALCIECLQFHDRMIQQLTQVRECLSELSGAHGAQDGARSWSEVRARLAARLASDSQRALLDLLLPVAATHVTVGELRRINRSEGSVELF